MGSNDTVVRLTDAWTAITRAATSSAQTERLREASGVALSRSSLGTLWLLASDGPQLISELAEGVGVDVSTMSRLLRQLERDGLVERARQDGDQRCVLIRLTEAGVEAHQRVSDARTAILARVLEDWSQADRTAFVRLMNRFAEGFVALSSDRERRPVAAG
jgi:DNA-binding MarR family transcriptional regulator